ncbi:MAG: hypothetical protein A3C80_01120 [Candidatus Ryanbacteria bacterium RIFCSPHIGHO2_02_FULL_45_43]|uniref:TVP38/TMEM64 family membrane protein n=1 Tax=Candidatus Ryanbacteria bacterium RIFCSPHIGHO2_01_45_13 TaxID=1802112 RepID=A0A1G2FZ36_9BACT|nr:MAG: hypothetical protein A2W41_02025 [Candidatus Ryanbacteria bacterium RIFCSPHIGHO2_01_45_13]OGZ48128.1 MAG: hypothetical protein A3C80_01120 [Candidatus Ryanbacteria bacterium RIFCSPHIGHO2_02_FULL_45_43]OGZ49776.1 MAG: hypothetical protein A3E55_00945 [Candidatus Ryanbacteria bacterium RIFCSPHIGHO2_12_FULL_44_20]OGZ51202.1 MAG: hypothetical protein A3A17_04155 [Candidatus Ryanbacteria bacterium RIFCSPLOWO2_01_FULL_44_230]OGZ55885.1 MAG: hypothetical protein A3F85_00770 [Candidatus Ryanbac
MTPDNMRFSVKHRYMLVIVFFVVFSVLFSLFLREQFEIFKDRESLMLFVRQFGIIAPIVVVAIVIVETVIAPLPGGIMPIIAGAVFGPVLGTLYSWIGNVFGSLIAFSLSRIFGESVIRVFSPHFDKQRYSETIRRYKNFFWFLYATPFVAVDVLSFALGASTMKLQRFALAIMFAFFVRMAILNMFGDAIARLVFE